MYIRKDNITVMGIEIERKFLIIDNTWKHSVTRSVKITQGYLANTDKCSIRIRSSSDIATINIKSMRIGVQRSEFEYPIPTQDADYLLENLCVHPVICKTRNYVRYTDNLWEIDVFEGPNKGLIVAEIELENPEQKFNKPSWLGEEVTNDKRYYNISLVDKPYQNW